MDPRDYLELEALLHFKLTQAWGKLAKGLEDPIQAAVVAGDYSKARELAEALDMSAIGPVAKVVANAVFQGCISWGASNAAGGRPMVTSLDLSRPLKASIRQFLQQLELNCTGYLQDRVLQSIAAHQLQEETGVVQKADKLKPLVSFRKDGDDILKMVSSLHTSRLGTWGFIAEADFRGISRYRLNAMLDNRTSDFCRFIHGKEFAVDDARDLIDKAVSAENPDDLKQIQPWPKQTKKALEEYQKMSGAELVSAGLQVPPYHPGCRTLVVRVGSVPPLKRPEVEQAPIPPAASAPEDFSQLGVKLSKNQLELWNSYVGLSPVEVFSKLTGYSASDLLKKKAGLSVRVSPEGKIRLGWKVSTDTVKFNGGLTYHPTSGVLQQSLMNFTGSTVGGVADYFMYQQKAVKAVAESVAAVEMTVAVAPGQALSYLSMGYHPSPADWQLLKLDLSAMVDGGLADKFKKLPPLVRSAVKDILMSKDEKSMIALTSLNYGKSDFLAQLLKGVSFEGVLPLEDKAIQVIFGASK